MPGSASWDEMSPEAYIRSTGLHTTINDALGEVMATMPADPVNTLILNLSKVPLPKGSSQTNHGQNLEASLQATLRTIRARTSAGMPFSEAEKKLAEEIAKEMGVTALRRSSVVTSSVVAQRPSIGGVGASANWKLREAVRQVSHQTKTPQVYNRLVKSKKAAQMLLQVALSMTTSTIDNTSSLIDETMTGAAQLLEADRCTFFLVDGDELVSKMATDAGEIRIPIGTGLAGHVARTGESINIEKAWDDPRFNKSVDLETGYRTESILCMPVKFEGSIVAVAQLLNKDVGVFNKDDEELFEAFSTFAGVCIRSHQLFQQALNEKRRTDTFVSILRKLAHTDIRDIDKTVDQIIQSIIELLEADRCTLFLVDKERDQLFSKVTTNTGMTEIRVNIGEGIAGTVARIGARLNIADAYSDARFNPETDRRMGYTTRTILAMPIFDDDGETVAVTQVINKAAGVFDAEDEELLEYFSLFAGIALSNARLYEFVVESGNKAMDLFNMAQGGGQADKKSGAAANFFGLVPSAKELKEYGALVLTDEEKALVKTPDFNPHLYSLKTEKHMRVIPFFLELFQASGFLEKYSIPIDVMQRFVICCKKKYRMVPYHSITHAFDVTQTLYMYLFEYGVKDLLTEFECFILMVSGVLHDIDHMGLNNSFHFKAETPMGVLSAASGAQSVLEVHHCNLSIELLGIPECNIFANLDKNQKKEAFKCLIYNILATDMAKHKEYVDNFKAMSEEGYDKENPEHRRLACALLLKCADISNVTKPFDISRLWGICATEEFFVQGEAEKDHKVELTPAFQKERGVELAQSQLGFINFMVAPMLDICIGGVFKTLEPFREELRRNIKGWEEKMDEHRRGSLIHASKTK